MLLRCLRALVVGCLAAGFVMLVPQPSSAAPALHLSRTSVIAGESVTITGTVGGRIARTVVLQRNYRGYWVRITAARTSRTGAFRFSYRPPATGRTGIALRVVAPAAKASGGRLAAIVSNSRTVTTVVPTATATGPSTAPSTAPVTITGSFTPARPGRATEVQRWNGTGWSRIAAGTQDRSGSTAFEIGLVEPGVRKVRVRTLAAAGAPVIASAVHAITITEPPSADSATPDGPHGVAAVAGDGEAIVTWNASAAADLQGYQVYSASSLTGPWTRLTTEPLDPEHEATFTASGLTNGSAYAFAVTSVHTSEVESHRALAELVTPSEQDANLTKDPCGPLAPKADGSAWRCTLAENFNGTTYDKTRWFPQQTFASGTSEAFACYRNTPDTIAVGNGVLSLSVVRVAAPVSCTFGKLSGSTTIIGGSLMTYQRFTQQYGRFEARIKTQATTLPGLQEAFWMWPDDRVATTETWPVAGEIDVSETYSYQPKLSIPFLHYRADSAGQQPGVNTAYCAAARGVWNTYTLVWTAERIEILINGTSCLVNTSGDSAFKKPYLLAFTAMLGSGENAYDGRVPLPATMQVDYVRVWK